MHICKQMVVEKYRIKLFVCIETLYQGFIFSCACNIIPAVRRTVRYNRVKLHKVNVEACNIRQRSELERTFLNIIGQEICHSDFYAISCVCSYNKRLRSYFAAVHLFKIIVKRIIDQYFLLPNYYCIDGYPVFSVFSLDNLVKTFGSVDETRKGIEYLETECRKAGLPGVHLQIVTWEKPTPELMAKAKTIGIDSFTVYNWLGGLGSEDYMVCMNAAIEAQERWSNSEIPFFPNASIGWDDTPRFPAKTGKDLIHYNKSPRAFAAYLQKAKEYADRHPNQVPLITVNAWNEWVEDSYLLPDRKYGFDYIKTVKEVLVDKAYEKYQKK